MHLVLLNVRQGISGYMLGLHEINLPGWHLCGWLLFLFEFIWLMPVLFEFRPRLCGDVLNMYLCNVHCGHMYCRISLVCNRCVFFMLDISQLHPIDVQPLLRHHVYLGDMC